MLCLIYWQISRVYSQALHENPNTNLLVMIYLSEK